MEVQYFPNLKKYKSITGGVKVGERVEFNIRFLSSFIVDKAHMVLTKQDETSVRYEMMRVSTDLSIPNHETFSFSLEISSAGLYFYHFEILVNDETEYIGADELLHAMLGYGSEWQLTVYDEVYQNVKWLEGGVMYQIMPDRFNIDCDRNMTKMNVVYRDDWDTGIPCYKPTSQGKILNNDFFGGNIPGIIKKLGYLKALGVTCIYMNPIFEANSNHKYDTGNYCRVDPDFGTEQDLKLLIKRADKKGIKILLDGVFSHTGDDSIYFNKYGRYDSVGAYQSQDSPYSEWYTFKHFPNEYNSWWNIDILPNVNEMNKHYLEYITGIDGILERWTKIGIGGWRWDVVDELPDTFIDKAVKAVKRANPNAIVLGEVWEDASNKVAYGKTRRYLLGSQLDSVMNYPFKECIIHFILKGDCRSLNRTINTIINNYPKHILDSLMNILGTHDTNRILTVFGEHSNVESRDNRAVAKVENVSKALERVKMASCLSFTLPGVPCIYYGDEIGMEGFEDPFNRRPMAWNQKNGTLLAWYKRLGKIRESEKNILACGAYCNLFSHDGVFAFSREHAENKLTIIINNSDNVYLYGMDNRQIDLLSGKDFCGTVQAFSCAILKRVN